MKVLAGDIYCLCNILRMLDDTVKWINYNSNMNKIFFHQKEKKTIANEIKHNLLLLLTVVMTVD